MSHQVLARKWRPHSFADVVGQSHVVQALTNALNQNYLHHAYLFTGTRGVGKTTIARILAKCLNCENKISGNACGQCSACLEIDSGRFIDLIEVDAASRTKVEDTRELLDNVQYLPTKGRFKVYLIDEVHMLSGHSFNALLKTLEEPPEHVKFLLATTDPQRLPATVLSRCLQFHLLPMPYEQISGHLQHILKAENIPSELEATRLIAKAADGSMRDALSLLDQAIAFGNGKVNTPDVKSMLGTLDHESLYALLEALARKDANSLLNQIKQLALLGTDFKQALAEFLQLIHQIALLQFVPHYEEADARLQPFAKQFSKEEIQLYYQIGVMGQRDLHLAPTTRSGFEMCLLRMLAFEIAQTEKPQAPKIQKPAAAPSIPVSTPIKISDTTQWSELLKLIKLTGPTLALAQCCELKSIDQNHVELLLDPKQSFLLNSKHNQRIAEALSLYLNRPVSVNIIPASSTLDSTPAAINRARDKQRQEAAEEAINNNPQVKEIIQAFDATLVKDSISSNQAE